MCVVEKGAEVGEQALHACRVLLRSSELLDSVE